MLVSAMVIAVGDRRTTPQVQEILSKYGCYIKARLGLHETDEGFCSNCGLIFLQLVGEQEKMRALEADLNAVPQTKAQLIQVELNPDKE